VRASDAPGGDAAAVVASDQATAGIAAGTFAPGAPPGLAAADPGTYQLGLLAGLGGGALSNPAAVNTGAPATIVRAGDFSGDGLSDLALLGPDGVTIEGNDGSGVFTPRATYPAGTSPTGLTVADINGDGKLDLLVGNGFGDILVLVGNGDGTFRPFESADRAVALAVVASANPAAAPEFVFANQGLDRVVVAQPSASSVLVDRNEGLLDPAAVQLADLNGDRIPDLLVVNSGANDVLIYPGLGNGQFGPELDAGFGFATGTDPVSVTVDDLNGDGRTDLLVANKGSNDLTTLLNVPTASDGFTFNAGPRLAAGTGPAATAVQDVNGDGIPDIVVSDSGSNQVRLLTGEGRGFFQDVTPTVFNVGSDPGPIFVGHFTSSPGLEVAAVDAGSNDVTLISGLEGAASLIQSFPTGGRDPVAAVAGQFPGEDLESLVIANKADGTITLLGGAEELSVEAAVSDPAVVAPTALAAPTFAPGEVAFYTATEGVELAVALALAVFPGAPTALSIPAAPVENSPVLLPLSENSLALIGTLLTVALEPGGSGAPQAEAEAQVQAEAEVEAAALPGGTAVGQSLFLVASSAGPWSNDAEAEVAEASPPAAQGTPAPGPGPVPFALGAEEALERLRQERRQPLPQAGGAPPDEADLDDAGTPEDRSIPPTGRTKGPRSSAPPSLEANVDEAIEALVSEDVRSFIVCDCRADDSPEEPPIPGGRDPVSSSPPAVGPIERPPAWLALAALYPATIAIVSPSRRRRELRTLRVILRSRMRRNLRCLVPE
jgi:hypothetical protein